MHYGSPRRDILAVLDPLREHSFYDTVLALSEDGTEEVDDLSVDWVSDLTDDDIEGAGPAFFVCEPLLDVGAGLRGE